MISIKLLSTSFNSLIYKDNYKFSWMLIVVSIITIVIKSLLYIYTHKLSKKYSNLLIEANARDHINDCIVTTFTLIASLLSLKNILWFDSIVGIGISIWICIMQMTLTYTAKPLHIRFRSIRKPPTLSVMISRMRSRARP